MEEHLSPASRIAAGLRSLPHMPSTFAATQAAWRFVRNPRLTLPQLAQPLLQAAYQAAPSCTRFALVVPDWSPRHYATPTAKADRFTLGQSHKVG